jgi:hypothetical protein
MQQRIILGLSAATVLGLTLLAGNAVAQQKTLKERIIGIWALNSAYEQGKDDRRFASSWGPDVKGTVIFSPTSRFALEIIAAHRPKSTAGDPSSPIGKAIAYFGTYSVDGAKKTITYHIERATYPQWDGIDRTARIGRITENELDLLQAPVHNPAAGMIIPHLDFKRVA